MVTQKKDLRFRQRFLSCKWGGLYTPYQQKRADKGGSPSNGIPKRHIRQTQTLVGLAPYGFSLSFRRVFDVLGTVGASRPHVVRCRTSMRRGWKTRNATSSRLFKPAKGTGKRGERSKTIGHVCTKPFVFAIALGFVTQPVSASRKLGKSRKTTAAGTDAGCAN